jgi:hypothetical protein
MHRFPCESRADTQDRRGRPQGWGPRWTCHSVS